MTTVHLTLPFPLSVNNLFAGRRRRYPSPKYVAWRRSADLTIMAARPPRLNAPVRISIMLHAQDNRPRDSDNFIKAVVDSLVRMQVIAADDHRVVRASGAEWGEKRNPPVAEVTITTVE